jgi:hypothetical protein
MPTGARLLGRVEVAADVNVDGELNLTAEDVAERLKIGRLNVFALMDSGRLKSVNIGTSQRKHRRTSEAWLAEFLASGGNAPASKSD